MTAVNNFLNKIYKYRYTAFKHFTLKNNIQEKIKNKKKVFRKFHN